MKNLTSIADHSDWLLSISIPEYRKFQLHRKRVEFGKQPLEKWMFVPCDEDGNVSEVPKPMEGDEGNWNYQARFSKYLQVNKQAKERCLFEGFQYDGFKYLDYKNYSFRILEIKNMTIENLVKYNLQLTPTALKVLGV